jgi:hypothetical protein
MFISPWLYNMIIANNWVTMNLFLNSPILRITRLLYLTYFGASILQKDTFSCSYKKNHCTHLATNSTYLTRLMHSWLTTHFLDKLDHLLLHPGGYPVAGALGTKVVMSLFWAQDRRKPASVFGALSSVTWAVLYALHLKAKSCKKKKKEFNPNGSRGNECSHTVVEFLK